MSSAYLMLRGARIFAWSAIVMCLIYFVAMMVQGDGWGPMGPLAAVLAANSITGVACLEYLLEQEREAQRRFQQEAAKEYGRTRA